MKLFSEVKDRGALLQRARCLALRQSSGSRKAQYQMSLSIWEQDGQRFVLKCPQSREAVGFIPVILQREQIAKEFFKGEAKVIAGKQCDDCIAYPYLTFPTLEELIGEALEMGEHSAGLSLVEGYVRFIRELPSQRTLPMDFIQEFQIPSRKSSGVVTCLLAGPIDCVPSNIMVDGQKWLLIDHEWTYIFPIPIDLVIYRGIKGLITNLQHHIRLRTSSAMPVVLFWGRGKNRTYIPHTWFEILTSLTTPLEELHYWDWSFQRSVRTNLRRGQLRLKPNPKLVSILPGQSKQSLLMAADVCSFLKGRFIRYVTELGNLVYNTLGSNR